MSDDAWELGHAAYPKITLDRDAFARYLAAHPPVSFAFASDLFLASACLAGDLAALVYLEQEILPAIDSVLARWGVVVADETRQQLRVMILVDHRGRGPLLAGYRGSGPLRRWVRTVAAREAIKTAGDGATVLVDDDALFDALVPASDPGARLVAREATAAFQAVFLAVLATLPMRERSLLRLHVLDGLSIDELAPMHGVHRATIARWIAAAKATVMRATRARLVHDLAITESEVDSLMRVVDSRLEIGDALE